MTNGLAGRRAYQMPEKAIILKELLLQCGINQADIAAVTGLARPTIVLTLNRGYIPTSSLRARGPHGPAAKDFKKTVENYISKNQKAMHWLISRDLRVEDIWEETKVKNIKNAMPYGFGARVAAGRQNKAFIPGDPTRIIIDWEVEMITQEAMKHFKIFRNPFIDDIQKDADIYMSEEHRYIEAAMIDAARHGGFLAVIGEVGSGKSVMRKKVVEQLRRDGDVLIIFPQIIDKTRVNAGSICDAIVMDLSSDKPKIKLEQKTRQCQKLLFERSKQNYQSCLMIEEAHDLNIQTLKYLKRFYEMEDGYKKLLGIILIGQTELKDIFSEAQHVDMREVIRRVQIAEISGLNGHIKDYLNLKFKRVGTDAEKIFANGAMEALAKRLTTKDRQNKTISHAYPLLVNNYAAKAMNLAFEMDENKVTEDIVMKI
jgi:type II secretory pathway predicted ATPase ExeA